ncbi:MAG: EamA family transporter [Candidatus Aenigmatarchaeota archaeon]
METWFALAILFAVSHSFVSLIDKVLLKKKIDPIGLSSFRILTNAAIMLVVFVLFFRQPLSLNWLVVIISLLFSISALCYFSALKIEDVSKVIPFGESIAILLSFFIPLVLLQETVSKYDYLGVFAIAIGGYIILTDGKISLPRMTRGLALIAINAVTISLVGVIGKIAVATIHPIQLTFLMYAFVSLWLVIVNLTWNRKKQFETIRFLLDNPKSLFLSVSSSILATIGYLGVFFALSIGKASEVLPLSRTLPLFVALLGWLFLKERYGAQRSLGALIMVAGMYLVYL